jgi:hypothetical protein
MPPFSPKLKLIKTLWGIDEPVSTQLFQSIKDEGYHGVEIIRLAWTFDEARDALIQSANEAGLALVCQIHTTGGFLRGNEYIYCDSYDVSLHKNDFQSQLHECVHLLKQISAGGFINVHAGVDAWSLEEATDFLKAALEEIDKVEFLVTFETHRQRLFCNPFQTRDILLPNDPGLLSLKLNADLSHWYCSSERVFDARQGRDKTWWPELLVNVVAPRCHYIHARFGWSQGPQMADPSAPECQAERDLQLRVWKILLKEIMSRDNSDGNGNAECFVSPELGPTPYLPVLPNTQEPVASLPAAVAYTKVQIETIFAELLE